MNKLIPMKSCALTLVLASALTISSALVAAPSDPLSRIELVETLAPLIPIEKQMAGDYTRQYTDLASITDTQRLILNGYLAQSNTKSGTSASLFSPTMGATRAQAAVMIHRMVSAANPKWTSAITESTPVLDANTVAWAKASIVDLVNAGVIEPVGPGYVFPKRAIDAQTATQWVDSARVFIPKPEPIEIHPEPTPSETQPTAAIVTVLTEPAIPTEAVAFPTLTAQTPAPTVTQTKATQDHTWQVRVYGGLSLGQSPYQSNQPPAEVVEERYQKDTTLTLSTEGSGSPKNKRLYGLESGIEFSRKVIGKPFWLVTGYGYGIVKETMPATTITMPVVYYEKLAHQWNKDVFLFRYNYADPNNKYEIFNFGEHVVRKTTHTIRLGLQHAFYKKTMQKAHIECYWGGGLAISTAAIWGSVLELPQQNINKDPIEDTNQSAQREDYITREKVRSFYYTQTQASAYGELGGLASRNSMHVGVQARFQLNPGELSVDEKGNKRLTREISSLGTIFVGRRF